MTDLTDLSAELAALTPDQRELLMRRLTGVEPRADRLPLSFTQRQLWFLDRVAPDGAVYNIPFALRLHGRLDVAALRAAVNALVARQEALRLVFDEDDDGPYQTVRQFTEVPLPVVDLRDLPAEERAAAADREAADHGATSLDLRTGPLLATRLVVLDDEEHLLLGVAHHIVFDAWSGDVFTTELVELYRQFADGTPAALPELRDSFTAFASRQSGADDHLAYWRTTLAGAPATSTPRPDRPRPKVATHRGGRVVRPLPTALSAAMRSFARDAGVTVNAVALAGLSSVLRQTTGQDDLVIGMPAAGRTRVALEPLIGSFANMLVLRLDLSGALTARDLARRVHQTVGEAFKHQDAPYARVVEEVAPPRDPGINPLFQVMFTVADASTGETAAAGVRFAPVPVDNQLTDFDLFVTLHRAGAEFELVVDYNADLYLDSTAATLADRVLAAVTDLTTGADTPLPSLRRDRIAVAATFTTDLVLEPLRFLLDVRQCPAEVNAAPYGQLVQHLLTSDDTTVLLLRWEDWLRHADSDLPAVLDAAFTDLATAVTAFRARSDAPLVLVRCPATEQSAMFARLDDRLAQLRARVPGVTVDFAEEHPVPVGLDQTTDNLAHIPYTPEYFAALATIVANRLPTPEPDAERAAYLAELHADVVLARSRPRLVATAESAGVQPATPTEKRLAEVWRDVLGVDEVAADADFFSLGGHSLLATQLLSQVRREFGREVSLYELFTNPTVARLAEVLDGAGNESTELTRAPEDAVPVASAVQQRLWAASRLDEDQTGGNTMFAALLRGKLDVDALAAAVTEVARRHEVLRTTFVERDGVPVPVVHDELPVWCGVEDIAGEPAEYVTAHATHAYSLADGPLLRVRVLRVATDEHYLLIGMHHIVCDAASWDILLTELSTVYDAFAAGLPSPLPEPGLRYRDFADHQQEWLQGPDVEADIAFWRETLRDAPVPVGIPGEVTEGTGGGRVTRLFPGRAVRELARTEGVTAHAVLLAAFAALLHNETGEADLVIGMPTLGRDRPESRDVIGCFADLLPLRLDVSGRPTFRRLARRMHHATTEAQAHQLPFPRPMRLSQATARNPLRCVLNYADLPDEDPVFAGLSLTELPVEEAVADFDMLLTLSWRGDELEVDLSHPLSLYSKEKAEQLVTALGELVDTLTTAPDTVVGAATAETPGRPVVVASSFPMGELAPTLRFWSNLLGEPGLAVRTAPTGQVLRPLLDPDGPFRADPTALHVLLLRWEDWLPSGRSAGVAVLEQLLADLVAAVGAHRERTGAELMIGLCPPSAEYESWAGVFDGLDSRLTAAVESVLSMVEWARRYGATGTDPVAIATTIARWAYRHNHRPVPVLALDPTGFDRNTLVRDQMRQGRRIVLTTTPTDPELAALVTIGAVEVGTAPEVVTTIDHLWPLDAPLTGAGERPLSTDLVHTLATELTTVERISAAVANGFVRVEDGTPRTDAERTLAAILCEVLHLPSVGIHDDFYDLGGDSLQAIAVAFHAVEAGLRLSARDLTERRTIAALDLTVAAEPVRHEIVTGEVPLTPAQLWWFECVAPTMKNPNWFNHPYYLELRRPLPATLLAEAVRLLAEHHDALRLRFSRDAGVLRQQHTGTVPFTSHDVTGEAAMTALATAAQSSLDLFDGPTCRVEHFANGDGSDRLLIVAHHLVVDAISRDVLLGDLQTLCAQLERGEPTKLPAKTTAYSTWAQRLSTWDNQSELPFWKAQTAAGDLSVPPDHPDAVARLAADAAVSGTLTTDETDALHEITRRLRVSMRDLIVWAVTEAVAARTGERACLLATTGHGRENLFCDLDLSRTVGWFQVMYPVLVRLSEEGGPEEVAAQLAAVPRNGIGYGTLRFATHDTESRKRLAAARAPRLAVNYMGNFGFDEVTQTEELFDVCSADYGPTDDGTGVWPYDLDVGGVIVGGRLRIDVGYNADVYDRETADGFLADVRAGLLSLF